LSVCGIGVDVAAKLASQIKNRSEHTTSDHVAFDFGEPDLDLIEPRRIGRCEVQPYLGMRLQKISNGLGLVRREVIENDVDLLLGPTACEISLLGGS
jgi:hypothetical protein